jgi:hypothetical protein
MTLIRAQTPQVGTHLDAIGGHARPPGHVA